MLFQLIATNTKGCSDDDRQTKPIHLFIYPIPTVNAGADTTIVWDTSTLQLYATGSATTYNWLAPADPAAITELPGMCDNPVANPVP